MRKNIVLILKTVVSLALLWAVYRQVPLEAFRAQLAALVLPLLIPIFALLLLNSLLSAWKWRILLRADDIDVPLGKLFICYLIGTFFNLFLPSSIGGDAYRVYDIGRHTARLPNAFASVLADRLSGFIALVTLAILAAIPIAARAGAPQLMILPLLAALGLAVAVWLLTHRGPAEALLRLTRLDRFAMPARLARQCVESFILYRHKPGVLPRIMALSFVFQVSMIACVALMGAALRIRTDPLHYGAFVPLIELLVAIPISIYGLGLRDAAYAFFFGLVDVPDVQTRALALLFLFTNVVYALIGGVLFLLRRPAGAAVAAPRGAAAPGPARLLGVTAAATLLVWALFAWPLPRHFASGIPSSARNTEARHARAMIPGDHLQLLYHFRLAADMLGGGTPWMHNPYEFNTGDDSERVEPDPYYVPFSLVFALGSAFAGPAAGWNFAGLVSLLLTYGFTWRLARRYTARESIAIVAALVGIALPYRWITLLGGSPTGLAMALAPMLLLGLDIAVRENRPAGGLLAGLAVLFAYCSDLHVFFFAVLAVPAWCAIALGVRIAARGRAAIEPRRLALALLPLAVLGLLAYALSRTAAAGLEDSAMAGGWSLREVARYSPWRRGLFTWTNMGLTNQIYLGFTVPATIVGGALLALFAWRRKLDRSRPTLVALLLVGLALAVAVALALGADGPGDGALLRACRKLIPPYRMVRQPAKIYCLMPSLLAVMSALALSAFGSTIRGRRRFALALAAFTVLMLAEYRAQISPTLCLLDREQDAYRAVAEAAADTDDPPRAVAVPLWPGDSHWSSLYQHYAFTYRIRMLNGYRPAVPAVYVEEIFKTFESINQGALSHAQLDALSARGIHYLLLHEDAFPEQVSPFPVGVTLQRLLANRRLELLTQAGRVWAFRILDSPMSASRLETNWEFYFPARHWEMERAEATDVVAGEATDASGGRFVSLATTNASVRFGLRAPITPYPDLRILLRVRGNGVIEIAQTKSHSSKLAQDRSSVAVYEADTPACRDGCGAGREVGPPVGVAREVRGGDAWEWLSVPVEAEGATFQPAFTVALADGEVALDVVLLAAGEWFAPPPGEALDIPPPCFFHAGYTEPTRNAVVLERRYDPDRVVFYGPNLPLEPGRYTLALTIESDAAPGVRLGELGAAGASAPPVVIRARGTTEFSFDQPDNRPVRFEFRYARNADLAITGVTLRRTVPS